jgi:ABC-2 type transport system permease protein
MRRPVRAWWAQTCAEIVMTLRRGETLLLTVGIPVALLVFFSETSVLALPTGARINYLAPGVISLCVMSTALVALSIATGFERSYGVLRRLRATPLGAPRFIFAKLAGVLVVEVIQVAVIVIVAVGLGWRPHGGAAGAVVMVAAVVLATSAFAGIGLVLAGTLRAEANLAASNGLYLILLLLCGFVIPVGDLPRALADIVVGLPSGALADTAHRILGHGSGLSVSDGVSLGAWSVAAPLFATRFFRFS